MSQTSIRFESHYIVKIALLNGNYLFETANSTNTYIIYLRYYYLAVAYKLVGSRNE